MFSSFRCFRSTFLVFFRLTLAVCATAVSHTASANDGPGGAAQPRKVRVAGIVLKLVRGDKDANFRRIEPRIREAAANGAKIVCTTECFLDGYAIADQSITADVYRSLGEPIPDGKYYRKLAALADELNVNLVAGIHEVDDGKHYNAAVFIGPNGQLVAKYHKQRLGHEVVWNTPGNESLVFDTTYGRVGMMICADRGSRDIVTRFHDNGAVVLFCPSGGGFGPEANHKMRLYARENNLPIVFVHPAEFLVVGSKGEILDRTILGNIPGGKISPDQLIIRGPQIGGALDLSRSCYYDLPIKGIARKGP
jgi:predicted amidohydrolase